MQLYSVFSIYILLFANLTVALARVTKHLGSSQIFQPGSHIKLIIGGFHGQAPNGSQNECLKFSWFMADGVTTVPWDR